MLLTHSTVYFWQCHMHACALTRAVLLLQALLGDVREIVSAAQWGELDNALSRIQGVPNNLESNIRDAAYSESLSARCRLAQAVQPQRHPRTERTLRARVCSLTACTVQTYLCASSGRQASHFCEMSCPTGFRRSVQLSLSIQSKTEFRPGSLLRHGRCQAHPQTPQRAQRQHDAETRLHRWHV